MTLRARVVAIVAALTVLGVTVAAFTAYRLTSHELYGSVDHFLQRRANEVPEGQRPPPIAQDGRAPALTLPFDADAAAQSLDRQGRVIASSEATLPVGAIEVDLARNGGDAVIRDVTIDGAPYRMITVPIRTGGALQVAREIGTIDDVLAAMRWRLTLVGGTLAAFAAALGLILMRRATRPLEDLTAAAERVAASSDLSPLGIDRHDEVGRLGRSFDRMLDALRSSRDQQRRLVQDAGHELRTPLTSLRANLELLQRLGDAPAGQRDEILVALVAETEELGALFDEVLQLAAGDLDLGTPEPRMDLRRIVGDATGRCERRTGRELRCRVAAATEAAVVPGHPVLVERALTNLLGNAHKFSPGGTPIEVDVTVGTSAVVISVRDHGPGIPESELPLVFDRFHRAEEARSAPGSGLGLAIVSQVAERHGGAAFARNAPDGGAVVGFTLALA